MGRYYSGDINGKFAVGIQPSRDGEQFGMVERDAGEIPYTSDDDTLETCNERLRDIEQELSEIHPNFTVAELDTFFETRIGYNEKMISDYFHDKYQIVVDPNSKLLSKYLELYFSYKLGVQIRDCIVAQGYCEYTADE